MTRRIAEPTRMRARDMVGEAVAVIAARPLRSALTGSGTLLAVTGFVAVLGLASTAAGQVTSAFNQRLATAVRLTVARQGQPASGDPFPPDTQRRVDALHGVVVAGMYWRLTIAHPSVVPARPASVPAGGPLPARSGPALVAATPGFLAAARAQLSQGRLFGAWDQARAEPACLLGAGAARRLGVTSVGHQPSIMINGLPCAVVGVISHVSAQRWIINSVLMPSTTAITIWDSPPGSPGAEPGVLIRTRPGAAELVARQAPFAISPDSPARYLVTVPPSPARLRGQVTSILIGLFLTLAATMLLVSAVSIANVTLLALAGRTAEIGLRRALGARRRHIAGQILVECALLGLLGGIAGASLGVIAVVLVALGRDWTPVIAPLTVLPAPLIGVAAGLLAGLYPSWRAARIEPAGALSNYPAA